MSNSNNKKATTLEKSESNESSNKKVRCMVQQCQSAKLQIRLADQANNIQSEFVEIGRGAVLFVCFIKDAQESDVEKLVNAVLNAKLSEVDEDPSKHISILDLPGSILIVPQATLGGKMKGKMFQYHNNVSKDLGFELYNKFVDLMRKSAKQNEKWSKINCKIENGTYGIRQVYSTETNGPYLHLIEF